MTERKRPERPAPRAQDTKEAEAIAARQRARDRAGEEGLPKSSGAPRRRASS